MSINTANISYNAHGTPVADAFDDVYFSNHDGMAETEHVFIDNNALPDRWIKHSNSRFIIAETGFGTGLNFLTTVKHFAAFRRDHSNHTLNTLYFISFEKFPIRSSDLSRALQQWPELSEFSTHLLANYPPPIAGCHRITFEKWGVVLDLWFGDVNEQLPLFSQTTHHQIDAWYLDGFAPAKNPDMWQQNLFHFMALMTQKGGTFSTFTAAGFVKRGLIAAQFAVEKCRGFGKKRDMLRGSLPETTTITDPEFQKTRNPRYWHRLPAKHNATKHKTPNPTTTQQPNARSQLSDGDSQQHVAVIGGGLAGLNTSLALLRRGYRVSLFEKQASLASGASGNLQGGFYPQLNVDFSRSGQLYSQCFYFARHLYQHLHNNGFTFEHDFCGVLQLSFNASQRTRHEKLLQKAQWPEALIRGVNKQEAEAIAGVTLPAGGLFIPQGGWINPTQLVHALAQACQQYQGFHFHTSCHIDNLQQHENGWQLSVATKQTAINTTDLPIAKPRVDISSDASSYISTDIVVLANSYACQQFSPCEGITLQPVRGQVEHIPEANEIGALKTVLCHKGYLAPAANGQLSLGATFDKNNTNSDYQLQDEQRNLDMVATALPGIQWANSIATQQAGRASIRGTTADHLPLMGNVPNIGAQTQQYQDLYKALSFEHYPEPEQWPNLFMLAGLGSRGLCTAPLLAEALACQISGNPLPLSQTLLNTLSPNRFLIRQLIRNQRPGAVPEKS